MALSMESGDIDMTLDNATEFFGWCALIGFGVLLLATVMLVVLRNWIIGMHRALFDVSAEQLRLLYMQYLANFKIAWLFLCVIPWLSLQLVG